MEDCITPIRKKILKMIKIKREELKTYQEINGYVSCVKAEAQIFILENLIMDVPRICQSCPFVDREGDL